jgi:hypothetical protein
LASGSSASSRVVPIEVLRGALWTTVRDARGGFVSAFFPHRDFEMLSIYKGYLASFGNLAIPLPSAYLD